MCALCWTQQPSCPADDPCPLLLPDATPASPSGKPASPHPVWDVVGSSCRKQGSPSMSGVPHKPAPCSAGSFSTQARCVSSRAPCPQGAGTGDPVLAGRTPGAGRGLWESGLASRLARQWARPGGRSLDLDRGEGMDTDTCGRLQGAALWGASHW